jgi:mersacidin/lichenicidin family type 2 lantibiotic
MEMPETDIILAWKDQEYRQSLTEAEQVFLPDNPAGILELSGKGIIHLPRLDTLSLIFGELTLFPEPPK